MNGLLENVVSGSVAVCLASISGHLGSFDPKMDAILDAPLRPDFAERFRSQFTEDPEPGATYRLAKRGVIRSCERAALDWARNGGGVVSLSPGLIDTDMGQLELANNPVKAGMARITPIRSSARAPTPCSRGMWRTSPQPWPSSAPRERRSSLAVTFGSTVDSSPPCDRPRWGRRLTNQTRGGPSG